jgi:hypothetical protein
MPLAEALVGRGGGITAIAPDASLTELTGLKADIIVDPRYRSGVACGVTIEDVPVGLDR